MNKNIRSSYKKYVQTTEEPVPVSDYIKINELYNKFLIGKALESFEVTLPSKLGTLCIVGRKPRLRFDENGKPLGLAPDWVKTKQLWESNPEAKERKQLLYHTNAETEGVRYKWVWSKKNILIENKTLYALRLTRTNKRTVHRMIKEGKQFIIKN